MREHHGIDQRGTAGGDVYAELNPMARE